MKTYPQARQALFEYLELMNINGWEVYTKHKYTFKLLKVPYVLNAKGTRFDFHPWAVYANGHSLFVDIRQMTTVQFEEQYRNY